MEQVLENHLIQATKAIEDQLDTEIDKLDRMDDDDLEVLRQKRLENMKKAASQKQDWLAAGHGRYFEVADEKEFFAECKKSKNVICHFYRDSTENCKIVDMHMDILARKHVEAKFIKINAEKAHFLTERLRIKVMPTICIAKDSKTIDFIVGFSDLGNTNEFSTEVLEWRIAQAKVISYNGDLLTMPESEKQKKKQSILGQQKKKTIRGRDDDDSSDENDW